MLPGVSKNPASPAGRLYAGFWLAGFALALNAQPVPSLEQALSTRQDVWGLAAMAQANGPSYSFFESLLPPLRYVNAAFRHYPIVLSAPAGQLKARLISNGSAINARADLPTWREVGLPVTFAVGQAAETFGADLARLSGPQYLRGYLPIVQLVYTNQDATYESETFAPVDPVLADNGVLLARFRPTGDKAGRVLAFVKSRPPLLDAGGALRQTNGAAVAWHSDNWKWDPEAQALRVDLRQNESASLAIPARPVTSFIKVDFAKGTYEQQRQQCIDAWESLLHAGMSIQVPEPRVNDAWRALVISLFMLANRDHLNYSAGNAYERMYEAESGDAIIALLLYGFAQDARRMLPPLLDYSQQGLDFHDAGLKLQFLAQYYWLTRDRAFIELTRQKWEPEVKRILNQRTQPTGLLPKENYCGDIHRQVDSLNSNANCWRGLRDIAAVLEAVGDAAAAQIWRAEAAAFRQAILKTVDSSERRDVQPPFIPIALFGAEQPYEALTASEAGSYWALMAPYVLGSGVFGQESPRDRAIIDYLQERGGICMGMIRFHQHSGLFANEDALDDLYGLRYTLKLLELDDVDRALVSFYGKLAQGLTRDTDVGAEGTGLRPLDAQGRPMYLPPNCTAQAYFLTMLRFLLVQDWVLEDDGRPETLRLGFATPRLWLADGQTIRVDRAPTAFGLLSFQVQSRLSAGEVLATLDLPSRNPPRKILLRVRLPQAWRLSNAVVGSQSFTPDERGTVDLSGFRGRVNLRFSVRKM